MPNAKPLKTGSIKSEKLKKLAIEKGAEIKVDSREFFNKQRVVSTLTTLQVVIFELDESGTFTYLSDNNLECLDFYQAESSLTSQSLVSFASKEDAQKIKISLTNISKHKNSEVIKFKPANSPHLWLEAQICRLDNHQGEFIGFAGLLRDITEKEIEFNYINFLAYHDTLTGLPNMFWLEDRWTQILTPSHNAAEKVFLILIDIDDFNEINEHFGQKIGDRALLAISRRINSILPERSHLIRWNGDKFIIILMHHPDNFIDEFRKKLKTTETEIVTIEDVSFYFKVTGGYVVFPDEDNSPEELFSKAHSAMIYAKEELRNEIISFKDTKFKNQEKFNLFTLKNSLTEAIHKNRIKTFFQPQIEAKSLTLAGFEALARWQNDALGHVPPSIFISVAEKHGLIGQLSYQILSRSLEFVNLLVQNNIHCKVAANISQRQLFSSDLIDDMTALTKKYNLDSQSIILEITESISMSNEKSVLSRLEQLRTSGFQISIDDFGTRYSSLSRLHAMPVSELKIDMSFISRIHTDKGLKMIQAINQLAKALGLRTVAEGVEDAKTVEILRNIGVDYLQGYYFSQALDFDIALDYAKNFSTLNQEYIRLFGPSPLR